MSRSRTLATAFTVIAALAVPSAALAGTVSFAPYTSIATGSGVGAGPAPQNTAATDLNGDGRPDVVTANNFGQADLLVLLNQGAGTFASPTTIAGTAGSQSVAVGDVNRDGHPDVVGMTPTSAIVAIGDGHGAFTVTATYPLVLGGQVEAILSDLNGDGRLDIAAPTFGAIQTLIGNGDGTFHAGPSTAIPDALAPSAIASATLNNDAAGDLFAVDGASGTVFALRGTGTGAFTISGRLIGGGLVPEDIRAVDLNGDGIDDLAAIGSFSFSLATALSDGRGGFATKLTPKQQYAGIGPASIAVGDLNADGRGDLVVSDVASPTPSVLVFTGNGTVSPTAAGAFGVATAPQTPVIADFDGDGRPDIATPSPGTLSVLRNTTP